MNNSKSFHLRRITIFFVLYVIYALVSFHRNCTTIVIEEMAKAYHVEESNLHFLESIYFYSYGIMQIFAGLLCDVIEPAYIMTTAQIICGLGSIFCGYSTTITMGTIGRLFVGVGCGPVYVPVCRCMANWFDLKWYPTLTGVLLAISGVGGMIATRPLEALVHMIGWRNCFYLFGGMSILFSSLCILFVRGNPTKFGYESVNAEMNEVQEQNTFVAKLKQLQQNAKVILKKPGFYLVTLYSILINGPYYLTASVWGKPMIRDIFKYSKNEASNVLISCAIGVIVAAIILPFVSDHIHSRKWVIFVTALMGVAVHAWVYIVTNNLKTWEVWLVIGIIGFTTLPTTSIAYPLVREYFHASLAGSAIGMSNCLAFCMSGAYMQVCSMIIGHFGSTIEEGRHVYTVKGYRNGFWLPGLIFMFLAMVVTVILKDSEFVTKKKDDNMTTSILSYTDDR